MEPTVKYIPEGIPNIKDLFTGVDFNNVEEYYITAYDSLSGAFSNGFSNGFAIGATGEAIATTRINKIGCCCSDEKIRIHFINSLGEVDSINFTQVEENEDIKSDSWTKTLPVTFDRTKGGSYRQNIRSNEVIDAETNCYSEKDQYWIKELFESPIAWIEMNLPNGFNTSNSKEYVPIEILDAKIPIRKKDKRYEYLVKIKFQMSNANINLR